mgnify:CR=1 FL=1
MSAHEGDALATLRKSTVDTDDLVTFETAYQEVQLIVLRNVPELT